MSQRKFLPRNPKARTGLPVRRILHGKIRGKRQCRFQFFRFLRFWRQYSLRYCPVIVCCICITMISCTRCQNGRTENYRTENYCLPHTIPSHIRSITVFILFLQQLFLPCHASCFQRYLITGLSTLSSSTSFFQSYNSIAYLYFSPVNGILHARQYSLQIIIRYGTRFLNGFSCSDYLIKFFFRLHFI